MREDCLIVKVFRDPEIINTCNLDELDILIRQARRGDILGSLYAVLNNHGLLSVIPSEVYKHLSSAWSLANKHERVLRWEVNRIQKAIENTEIPVILLKGAAYLLQSIQSAQGRLYADIDIMVPKNKLPQIEQALVIHGWISVKQDTYDQRYYREWMHEIPPMRHRRRQTVIDVHHRILPITARAKPDPEKLFENSIEIQGYEKLRTLSHVDMVLHSAVHLFYEGELDHGLRDLLDLHYLIEKFKNDENFWDELVSRAGELDLGRPLYYALRYLHGFLETDVDDDAVRKLEQYKPGRFLQTVMDIAYQHALVPKHASCNKSLTGVARWMLYIRSHYLRMPFYLLIPHLLRKSLRKKEQDK